MNTPLELTGLTKVFDGERGPVIAVKDVNATIAAGELGINHDDESNFTRRSFAFDLLNGGDKKWGRYPVYREFGYQACANAAESFALGSVGAGLGATTADLKGGLGSASAQTRSGITVGAIAADSVRAARTNAFFAFDNGVGRGSQWTPEKQAAVLATLGYDGWEFLRRDDAK